LWLEGPTPLLQSFKNSIHLILLFFISHILK
jgi:hypothetical protein